MSTRGRIERAIVQELLGSRSSGPSLRHAVTDATRELRAQGLTDASVIEALGALVEDAGRACGADRPSLMSGELRWMPVRARVQDMAAIELAS
jgi:hypothetical protein